MTNKKTKKNMCTCTQTKTQTETKKTLEIEDKKINLLF